MNAFLWGLLATSSLDLAIALICALSTVAVVILENSWYFSVPEFEKHPEGHCANPGM